MKIMIEIPEDAYEETCNEQVELVIKIPRSSYEATCNEHMLPPDVDNVVNAIKDGTPLPEHYGRLIDENELIDEIVCEEIDGRYYDIIYAHSIYDAPTIIEGSDSK